MTSDFFTGIHFSTKEFNVLLFSKRNLSIVSFLFSKGSSPNARWDKNSSLFFLALFKDNAGNAPNPMVVSLLSMILL